MEVNGQIYPERKASGAHWVGGWVGLRTGMVAVTKRKNPLITPAGNRTSVVQLVT
jgi:hypothetical protein